MIHFFIKFLICFTKPKAPEKKETSKTKAVKTPISPKKKRKMSQILEPKEVKDEIPEVKDKNIIECKEKVREWCSIEYSLLEDVLPKVEINVVIWGGAAKVFTEDDYRALKTYVTNDLVWVYFVMVHKISQLEDHDVEKLKNSTINFKISQNQNKMMSSVVNDWPLEFVLCKKPNDPCDSDERFFSELWQIDPLDDTHKAALKDRIENFKISRPQKNTIVSMLQIEPCEERIMEKIFKITSTFPVKRDSQDSDKIKLGKKGKKETNGPKNKKKEKTNVSRQEEAEFQLSIRADLLIAGKYDASTEKRDITQSLRYVNIMANTSKILTEEQDNAFVPLIVTIQEIEGLPFNFMKSFLLRNIYARYELPNVFDCVQTMKIPLTSKDVSLDDTQVYFISTPLEKMNFPQLMLRPSVLSLAEALLTQKLVIKLYGEKDGIEEPIVEPCLFGERLTDHFIATPDHEVFLNYKPSSNISAELYLGSASFKLIKLIKGYYITEMYSIVTSSPVPTWDTICYNDGYIQQHGNENNEKSILTRFSERGCIPESLLAECCTRIKVKVSTGCLLTSITDHQLLSIPNVFFRLIVIFKNEQFAKNTVERIVRINSLTTQQSLTSFKSLGSGNIKPQGSFGLGSVGSSTFLSELRRATLTSHKAITGFFIHNQEECILVVETTPYMFPCLFEPIHGMSSSDGRLVCDTSLFFTKRLYEEFYPSYLYQIELFQPLDILLKMSSLYFKKTLLQSALQALLMLDLLRRTPSLYNASVNQLFPSCKQLISFNLEFSDMCPSETSKSIAARTLH